MTSIPPSEPSKSPAQNPGTPVDDQATFVGGVTRPAADEGATFVGNAGVRVDDPVLPGEGSRISVIDDLGEASEGATDLSGREMTLQMTGQEPPTGVTLSGREMTLQMTGQEPPTGVTLSGREMTLQMTGQEPATGVTLSGREMTLQTPVNQEPPTGVTLSGREMTLQTPVNQEPPTGVTLSGREVTLQTDTAGEKPGTRPDATPSTSGGRPKTLSGARPVTGSGTSVGFEDSWHLQGRKGAHTGQRWGDFELGGILGEGGMGAVYRAKQVSLKRRVAIKVLPPNLASDPRLLQRFQLEATTSSKLSSPHIVQVYFIGEHEDNHYFAMEYVDGNDLYDLLKKRRDEKKPLTPDEAAGFTLQAAKGLAEAARHGIVHRDIKPPNMMMTRDGLLKIADFGIVKVMGEHNLTMTGQAVGTPAYCSPEQGRGDANIDCRSDLYSLGVVFYELACGKKPFEATTPNALIYKHCYDEPELPQKLNPAISDEYQAVILRCLQKKPENRYQTADEMVRDLEAIRAGSMLKSAIANYKLGTGAAEAKREQMNWFQRNLVKLAIAAVLVVGGAGTGGYLWIQQANESANAAAKAEAQRKLEAAQREAQRKIDIEKAAKELRPWLAQTLDAAASVPAETEGKLAAFTKTVGDQDADAKRWKAKLDLVRGLQKSLAVLDGSSVSAAQRTQARKDLASYQEKVSTADAAAVRWDAALVKLDSEEKSLRTRLAELDSAQTLTVPAVEGLKPSLTRLADLVPEDDRQLKVWRATVTQFDQRISDLRAAIKPLDEAKRITESEHTKYSALVNQLRPLVATGDQDIQRWADKLAKSGGRVQELRRKLTDFNKLGRPPVLAQNAIKADLDELTLFVGAEDADVVQSQAKIKAANDAIAGYRTNLKKLDQVADGDTVHLKAIPAHKADLEQLTALALPGDDDVTRWSSQISRFQAVLDGWAKDLLRLEPSNHDAVSAGESAILAATLEKALAKGVIDEAKAGTYRQRLADEKKRIERLRTVLASVDTAASLGGQVRKDLARFALDVGSEDADVARWQAKARRVDALTEKLKPLDEAQRIPDQVQSLFDSLVKEVGTQDPDVVRWQDKVTRVGVARKALATLDRVEPLPAATEANLKELASLVGDSDEQYQAWRRKFDEVVRLKAALRPLPTTYAQSPEQNAQVKKVFRRLISQISANDTDVRIWAPRQQELDGPQKPAWAVAYGRDAHGLYADLPIAKETLRFRFVPTGRFVIGSPASESGRDGDEIQVPMVITQAFWILEHEVTQDFWREIQPGSNPSLFTGKGSGKHPVERVSWDDVQGFLAALNQKFPGLGADLPTETQWEYAARTGHPGPFPQERPDDTVDQLAWGRANSDAETKEIKLRFPNRLGLYDMLGNVAEWCRDAYAPYPTTETADHLGKGSQMRVARGGSWGDARDRIRVANRIPLAGNLRSSYLGFRLVLPVQWTTPPNGALILADAGERVERLAFAVGGGTVNLEMRLPQRVKDVEPVVIAPESAGTSSGARSIPPPEPAPQPPQAPAPIPSAQASPTGETFLEPMTPAEPGKWPKSIPRH